MPVCSRCERHGLECSGVRGTVFIDAGQAFGKKTVQKPAALRRKRAIEGRGFPPLNQSNVIIPSTIDLTGWQDTVAIAYMRRYLLRGGPVHVASDNIDFNEKGGDPHRRLLRNAVLSLAITFFGHQHGEESIRQKGFQLYGYTLVDLNQALSHSQHAKRDDVLIAVVTLGLLECFVPTGKASWLMHIQGLERLLELRGPEAHRNPYSRQLLQGIRRMLIFASLHTSKPSVLARPEWKRLEWKTDKVQKNTDEDLLNILADCPASFNRRGDLVRALEAGEGASALNIRSEILQRGTDLLNDLKAWRQCWGDNLKDMISEVSSESSSTEGFGSSEWSFSPMVTWKFSGPAAATTMMLYFATQIHILDMMASVSTIPPAPLSVIGQEPLEPQVFSLDLGPAVPDDVTIIAEQGFYIKRLQKAALNICRIVPYHLSQRDNLDAGSLHIGALAIKLAWKSFAGEASVEGRWLKNTIKKHQQESGGQVVAQGLWDKDEPAVAHLQPEETEND
ncbi:MAG: hypothetical protein M1820_004096 [Bogoriella megaspora]|nr:MAG: hypothetical protein M1820_004096 [Bogoriella megaspora]